MNASVYPVASGLDHYGAPPILIAASSETAARRAAETIDDDTPFFSIPIDQLLLRLDRQSSAAALWLELEDDPGPELDRILDRIDAEVGAGHFPAIIAAPLHRITGQVLNVSGGWYLTP